MPEYAITFARSARKELERLDSSVVSRIWPKIETPARTPCPPGFRKLRGGKDLGRIRVGDYRVVYAVDDDTEIVNIAVLHGVGVPLHVILSERSEPKDLARQSRLNANQLCYIIAVRYRSEAYR